MGPNQKFSVMAFVDREWYDDTLRIAMREQRSQSTTGFHVLIGEMRDETVSPYGVWFRDVPNPNAGPTAVMEFLVPWAVIRGVGIAPVTEPPKAESENQGGTTILKWPERKT